MGKPRRGPRLALSTALPLAPISRATRGQSIARTHSKTVSQCQIPLGARTSTQFSPHQKFIQARRLQVGKPYQDREFFSSFSRRPLPFPHFTMPKTVERTRKAIMKKKGTIDSLHQYSRDSKRLHRAQGRDEKLEKIASARRKRDQPYSTLRLPMQTSSGWVVADSRI